MMAPGGIGQTEERSRRRAGLGVSARDGSGFSHARVQSARTARRRRWPEGARACVLQAPRLGLHLHLPLGVETAAGSASLPRPRAPGASLMCSSRPGQSGRVPAAHPSAEPPVAPPT